MTGKEQLLGKQSRRGFVRSALLLGVLAAMGFGGWRWYSVSHVEPIHYATHVVASGDLRVTVTADGTLKPVRTVSIGSELSGIVASVNVDVNSAVKQGDVLIELDKAKLTSAVNQARASLASAKAKLVEANATVVEAKAKMKRYEELNRASNGKLPSRAELDEQRAVLKRAQAGVLTARAAIDDAEATLQTNETNLAKASIRSPVDGVVLSRSVEPGYAVAASLQAVELLTVATDLHELELKINVDEADVGQVKVGQPTSFTVAAYPNRHFPATLTKVAFGASSGADNVVTYTTYLAVKNPELALRSGMTATATIETARRANALLVPNTALRFRPIAPKGPKSGVSFMVPHPPANAQQKTAKETGKARGERKRVLYVLDSDGKAQRRNVTTGLTDGNMTEILAGNLKAGDKVIINQLKKAR